MKIIDACPFFNEIELYKIRLELLYDHVDAFCVCESNLTHAGNPKPYYFEERQAEFAPWIDKITYLKFQPDTRGLDLSVKTTSFDPRSVAWQLERAQRNVIAQLCGNFSDQDMFIVSDLDEIANPDVIDALRSGVIKIDKARLEMQMHYYYLNCKGVGLAEENRLWRQGFVASVEAIKKCNGGLSHLRVHEPMPVIQNGGWHFSYLGGAERIQTKINAAAHTEINRPEVNNLNHLRRCIELGFDHLGRPGYEYAFLPINSYPEKLSALMQKNINLVRINLL